MTVFLNIFCRWQRLQTFFNTNYFFLQFLKFLARWHAMTEIDVLPVHSDESVTHYCASPQLQYLSSLQAQILFCDSLWHVVVAFFVFWQLVTRGFDIFCFVTAFSEIFVLWQNFVTLLSRGGCDSQKCEKKGSISANFHKIKRKFFDFWLSHPPLTKVLRNSVTKQKFLKKLSQDKNVCHKPKFLSQAVTRQELWQFFKIILFNGFVVWN